MAATYVIFTVDMSTYPGFEPNSMTVCIAGSFTDWSPEPMIPMGNKKYLKGLAVDVGEHEFKYNINYLEDQEDLAPAFDENTPELIQSGPYTNRMLTITYPAPEHTYYPPIAYSGLDYWNAIAPPPPCFNHGTEILCLNNNLDEVAVAVQDLKVGTLVKTYLHGYRKVEHVFTSTMTNNPSNWQKCMYKMEKEKESDSSKDLIVTGWHAILVDELLQEEASKQRVVCPVSKVDDKYKSLAAFSKKFTRLEDKGLYTYYHFALESNEEDRVFGVWANNVLVETMSLNDIRSKNIK